MKLQPLPAHYDKTLENMHWKPLRDGDVFREMNGTVWYVEYTNSSGAYCLPLASSVREIGDKAINFHGSGKTISTNSVVQFIAPLEMGGNSPEFARYVKLEEKKGRTVAMPKGTKIAATFADFDDSPLPDAATDPAESGDKEKQGMAKKAAVAAKAKGNGNGHAKRDKAPKTVRKCTCGCNTETTGHFAPGHDARFHGWLKKLADGRMGPNELPAAVRKGLDLQQTKDGFKAKSPHYYQEA